MKVYGAAPNLALFENYVLVVLEEARLDYEKALPFVEVFLGEIFREEVLQASPGQIFLPDADEYRDKYPTKAGAILARKFFPKLAEAVRDYYIPAGSPLWADLEKRLRLTGEDYLSCPAAEAVVSLFIAAVLGQNHLAKGGAPRKYNCHSWRSWFYSLWDQPYEWGRLTINERLAEVNEKLYHFSQPPSLWNGAIVIQPQHLLEAHGFKVVLHPDKTVEYWR